MMDKKTKLYLAICFSFSFMILEIIGGIVANSLAIISDAVHLFSDITGFVIALLAVELAILPVSTNFTYGHGRAEVIGAFVSVLSLWIATLYLIVSALYRILLWLVGKSDPVNGKYMFIVASIGVFVNLCLAAIFHQEHHSASAFSLHGHNCLDGSCVRNVSEEVTFAGIDKDGFVSSELCGVCSATPLKRGKKCENVRGSAPRTLKQFGGMSYSKVGVDDTDSALNSELLLETGTFYEYDGEAEDGDVTEVIINNMAADSTDSVHMDSGKDLLLSPLLALWDGVKSTAVDIVGRYSHINAGSSINGEADAGIEDLNMRAVYLHVLTDMAQSIGVAAVGGIIWANPALSLLDPLSSLLFGSLIIWYVYLSCQNDICMRVY